MERAINLYSNKYNNNSEDIIEELDFINEAILNDLKIEKENYINKNLCLNKISKDIFKIKLNEDIIINIAIKDKNEKQIISFKEAISGISSNKKNKNLYYNENKDNGNIQSITLEENKNEINENIINYYKGLSESYKQQKNILDKIQNNIIIENKFNNYFILNKKWFNHFSKIFGNEETYQNNDIILDSINKITNIPELQKNEISEKIF